jgi:hypothetical protein
MTPCDCHVPQVDVWDDQARAMNGRLFANDTVSVVATLGIDARPVRMAAARRESCPQVISNKLALHGQACHVA